jgi:predicted ATPase
MAFLREHDLEVTAPVSFLTGDNGSGKSTLIEALAVAIGLNPEGGSHNFNFATRPTESALGEYLAVGWNSKPRDTFFLRAETFYNVATHIEELDRDPWSPPLLPAYGGISPHERSHGQSFLDLTLHRFGAGGLYVLDEPEAALSYHGCLALIRRMHDLIGQRTQFIIATHSPILLAFPGAQILLIDDDGTIAPVTYDQSPVVQFHRRFLAQPEGFLSAVLSDDS